MRLVKAFDRDHRVTVAPCQGPDLPERHGLTPKDCREAMWAVNADGEKYRAAAAFNATLAALSGTDLPLRVYSAPGVRQLQEYIYAWVARNRRRFPGVTAYCTDYPEECGGG